MKILCLLCFFVPFKIFAQSDLLYQGPKTQKESELGHLINKNEEQMESAIPEIKSDSTKRVKVSIIDQLNANQKIVDERVKSSGDNRIKMFEEATNEEFHDAYKEVSPGKYVGRYDTYTRGADNAAIQKEKNWKVAKEILEYLGYALLIILFLVVFVMDLVKFRSKHWQ